MIIVTETRYCDGCGVGPSKSGNVEYLGWLHISAHQIGLIGSKAKTADLCPKCVERVWASIPVTA